MFLTDFHDSDYYFSMDIFTNILPSWKAYNSHSMRFEVFSEDSNPGLPGYETVKTAVVLY
jgi:hypothetical protein